MTDPKNAYDAALDALEERLRELPVPVRGPSVGFVGRLARDAWKPRAGVLVSALRGENAKAAGLEPGDVIVAIGGYRCRSTGDLAVIVAGCSPGQVVDVKVLRGLGCPEETTLSLTLGDPWSERR